MPSDGAKLVMALAVAVAVGVIMIGPVSTVADDSTGTQNVVNETVTQDLEFNTTYDLDGYSVVAGSETVRAENGSTGSFETVPESQYTLDDGPGEITFDVNDSSNPPQAGDEVLITYDYEASDETTTLVVGFIPLALGLVIFVAVARATTDYL